MKKLCMAFSATLGMILVLPADAARDAAMTQRMEACFRLHAKLMDKPAVRNMEACWRAHGYLMERR